MHESLRRMVVIGLAAIILLITSCTIHEELIISASGSGSATLTISLHPIMLSYFSDLVTALTGVEGDHPVFDLQQLASALAAHPLLQLKEIERPGRGQLRMEITFDDLNGLFAEADARTSLSDENPSELFSFRTIGARRELTVRLDRSTVRSLMAFAPSESASLTEFLLPPSDGSVSRLQYQDELAWALEEYAPTSEVMRVLDRSVIEVVIRPAGRIESQIGGTVGDGTVTFSVPVLDLLTLRDERIYRVVFVP